MECSEGKKLTPQDYFKPIRRTEFEVCDKLESSFGILPAEI